MNLAHRYGKNHPARFVAEWQDRLTPRQRRRVAKKQARDRLRGKA